MRFRRAFCEFWQSLEWLLVVYTLYQYQSKSNQVCPCLACGSCLVTPSSMFYCRVQKKLLIPLQYLRNSTFPKIYCNMSELPMNESMECVCESVLALVIHLKRIGEPWKPPWSSSPMAAAEWQAAAVLASMTPSQASKRAWPERNE